MSDLRDRPIGSRWCELMTAALRLLDQVYDRHHTATPAWTLGGGTAIALRLAHRVSDDVDVFVGSTDLRAFTPTRNAAAKTLSATMEFPGHYLKYQLQAGEIDFLPGPMLSEPGFTWESFGGRPVALQTCEEVVLKKVRYRSGSFKARDTFDLAAVSLECETLPNLLLTETGDMLATLLAALERHDATTMVRADIRPLPAYAHLPQTAVGRSIALVSDLLRQQSTR